MKANQKITVNTMKDFQGINTICLTKLPSDVASTELKIPEMAKEEVKMYRQTLKNILDRKDKRFIMVVGPCSIHDPIAAFDYAKRLKRLADKFSDTLYIVMRAYLEKPRTTVGWKGFINDPCMDESYQIEKGLLNAQQLLITINELGLPVATEFLDPMTTHYLEKLISWGAIGARTVESQIHRELASSLDAPVGFKNGTDGSVESAINAIITASQAHTFMGTDAQGITAPIRSLGNRYGHLVLRGGSQFPNYYDVNVKFAEEKLANAGLDKNIIIDCSHANSLKDYRRQKIVIDDVVRQLERGNQSIVGAMLESNIVEGSQTVSGNGNDLIYGLSITDGCISWEETEILLNQTYSRLKKLDRFKG